MTRAISDILMSQFSDFVTAKTGLYFPKERWDDLKRKIRSAAHEVGFEDPESYVLHFLSSPVTKNQLEILASHLTIGETYFFRERRSFKILEEHILPELIHSRRETGKHLRIWSAGCSTGEEPYSMAMLLSKFIPDLKSWSITLLATDINPNFLQKALKGVYGEWSFRETSPSLIRERYFKKGKEGHFELLPSIRRMVTFSYHNLAEDSYPSLLNNTNAMDIIFCRNVLMYFSPDLQKRLVQNLYRCLVEGGWLIVSPSEASHVLFSQFTMVNFGYSIFYKKETKPSHSVTYEISPSPEPEGEIIPSPSILQYIGSRTTDKALPQHPRTPQVDAQHTAIPPEVGKREAIEPSSLSYQRARALYEQGRYEEAADHILSLISQGEDNAKLHALMAQVLGNQGKLHEALEWCEKAIASEKLKADWHHLRSTILQELRMEEEAMKSLKRVIYLDPNFVLAHFAMGILALQQGHLRESKKHFENALHLLGSFRHEEILPGSGGMTAARLMEIIKSTIREGTSL